MNKFIRINQTFDPRHHQKKVFVQWLSADNPRISAQNNSQFVGVISRIEV